MTVTANHETLRGLRQVAADDRLFRMLQEIWCDWLDDDAVLPAYFDASDGSRRGSIYPDLGDMTPYLWLAGREDAIDRLHGAAEEYCRNGILVFEGVSRPFENHDFLLSYDLSHRLTGRAADRERFLTGCAGLVGTFFSQPAPPERVDAMTGHVSRRLSSFGYGLLELLVIAARITGDRTWARICSWVFGDLYSDFRRRGIALAPRVAYRLAGHPRAVWTPGRPWARFFKDNSNLLFSAIAFHDLEPTPWLAEFIGDLWRSVCQVFLAAPSGWAFNEAMRDLTGLHGRKAGLAANAAALTVLAELRSRPDLAHLYDGDLEVRLLEAPVADWPEGGLLAMSPDDARQHLDILVDFTVAAARCLINRGELDRAGEMAARASQLVARHRTRFGLATLAGLAGPEGDVCVKYNFLAAKLTVLEWRIGAADTLSNEASAFVDDVFLIDR
jgi:hypothetical protein